MVEHLEILDLAAKLGQKSVIIAVFQIFIKLICPASLATDYRQVETSVGARPEDNAAVYQDSDRSESLTAVFNIGDTGCAENLNCQEIP